MNEMEYAFSLAVYANDITRDADGDLQLALRAYSNARLLWDDVYAAELELECEEVSDDEVTALWVRDQQVHT